MGACAPKTYWTDAMTYIVYLMNRMPLCLSLFKHLWPCLQTMSRSIPTFTWNHEFFDMWHTPIFTKTNPCALQCVFLGFNTQQKGYRCYQPPTRYMYVTIDVTFCEDELFFLPRHTPQRETCIYENCG